jgi:hypothetical protein
MAVPHGLTNQAGRGSEESTAHGLTPARTTLIAERQPPVAGNEAGRNGRRADAVQWTQLRPNAEKVSIVGAEGVTHAEGDASASSNTPRLETTGTDGNRQSLRTPEKNATPATRPTHQPLGPDRIAYPRHDRKQQTNPQALGPKHPWSTKAPEYLDFLGIEAPGLPEFDTHNTEKKNKQLWPRHVKDVIAAIAIDALRALPMTERIRAALNIALGWCDDPERYLRITSRSSLKPFRLPRTCNIAMKHVRNLVRIEKFSPVSDPTATPNSNLMERAEDSKTRFRTLQEPVDLNDRMTKADLAGIRLPTAAVIRAMAQKKFFVMLDAAAFFDQLGLSPTVRQFFRSLLSDGTIVESNVIPMGFKPACDVAQAVSLALLDFEKPAGGQTEAYIDNFFLAADSAADLNAMVRTFIERCAAVGCVINVPDVLLQGQQGERIARLATDCKNKRGMPGYDTARKLYHHECWDIIAKNTDKLVVDDVPALGEQFNLRRQTRRLTEATEHKLELAQATLDRVAPTRRGIAAVFGILFFASRVLNFKPARFYYAIRYFREKIAGRWSVCAPGADCDAGNSWDAAAPPCTFRERAELYEWLGTCANHPEVPLVNPQVDHLPVLANVWTDASAWGYGAVVEWSSGRVQTISRPWTAGDRASLNIQHSTVAEPHAIHKLMAEIFGSADFLAGFNGTDLVGRVEIHTDHLPIVHAVQATAGFAKGYMYNLLILSMQRYRIAFSFRFVPGSLNIADRLSRGFVN